MQALGVRFSGRVLVVAVSQMLALVVFGVLWVFGALVALWLVLVVEVSQMLALLALCVVHQLWRFFRCLL